MHPRCPVGSSSCRPIIICEGKLQWLDLIINAKKSTCMRNGPRFDVNCSNITTVGGHELTWRNELRYHGVFLTASRELRCSYDNTKLSFYRAFNAMFGKVGRCASEELLKMKCLPVLFYGLESCPLSNSQIKSLDFAINSAVSTIFSIKSQDIIDNCKTVFKCRPLTENLSTRKKNFLSKYIIFI